MVIVQWAVELQALRVKKRPIPKSNCKRIRIYRHVNSIYEAIFGLHKINKRFPILLMK